MGDGAMMTMCRDGDVNDGATTMVMYDDGDDQGDDRVRCRA